jgi:hypothetical protein
LVIAADRRCGDLSGDAGGEDLADIEAVVGFEVEVADDEAVEAGPGSLEERGRAHEGVDGEAVEGVGVAAGVIGELADHEAVGGVDEADAEVVAVADEGLDPVTFADGDAEEDGLIGAGEDGAHDDPASAAVERGGHEEQPGGEACDGTPDFCGWLRHGLHGGEGSGQIAPEMFGGLGVGGSGGGPATGWKGLYEECTSSVLDARPRRRWRAGRCASACLDGVYGKTARSEVESRGKRGKMSKSVAKCG